MTKYIHAQNGVVINIVGEPQPDSVAPVFIWPVDDALVVNVGDPFDPKDLQVDSLDKVALQALFRHENLLREIIRSIRTNTAINNAATTNGLPTTANSPDLTAQQFRTALKALI